MLLDKGNWIYLTAVFFVYTPSSFDLTSPSAYAIIKPYRMLISLPAFPRDHTFDHRPPRSTRKQRTQDRRREFAVERKPL